MTQRYHSISHPISDCTFLVTFSNSNRLFCYRLLPTSWWMSYSGQQHNLTKIRKIPYIYVFISLYTVLAFLTEKCSLVMFETKQIHTDTFIDILKEANLYWCMSAEHDQSFTIHLHKEYRIQIQMGLCFAGWGLGFGLYQRIVSTRICQPASVLQKISLNSFLSYLLRFFAEENQTNSSPRC